MDATAIGVAQEEENKQGMDEQDRFDGGVFFLPAITLLLFNRVLGADDAPFRPVMGTRGDAGTPARTTGGDMPPSFSGATPVAAAASETPSRCARALRERAGASPRGCRAASSTGRRTWSH